MYQNMFFFSHPWNSHNAKPKELSECFYHNQSITYLLCSRLCFPCCILLKPLYLSHTDKTDRRPTTDRTKISITPVPQWQKGLSFGVGLELVWRCDLGLISLHDSSDKCADCEFDLWRFMLTVYRYFNFFFFF